VTRLAHTPDGEELAYRIHGAPGKTPIVTLHGLVSSIEHWSVFTPYYAKERPVLSWEYRGHGGVSCSAIQAASVSSSSAKTHTP
jgi:pimeloyl-ACP methyl ester carboxylesterase